MFSGMSRIFSGMSVRPYRRRKNRITDKTKDSLLVDPDNFFSRYVRFFWKVRVEKRAPNLPQFFWVGDVPEKFATYLKTTRTQVQELGPRAGTKNCALMIIM